MAVRPGPGRALRAVRLSEVPEQLRLRALDSLLRTNGSTDGMLVPSFSLTERIALGHAAHRPSERVYWVSEKAYVKTLGKAS